MAIPSSWPFVLLGNWMAFLGAFSCLLDSCTLSSLSWDLTCHFPLHLSLLLSVSLSRNKISTLSHHHSNQLSVTSTSKLFLLTLWADHPWLRCSQLLCPWLYALSREQGYLSRSSCTFCIINFFFPKIYPARLLAIMVFHCTLLQ